MAEDENLHLLGATPPHHQPHQREQIPDTEIDERPDQQPSLDHDSRALNLARSPGADSRDEFANPMRARQRCSPARSDTPGKPSASAPAPMGCSFISNRARTTSTAGGMCPVTGVLPRASAQIGCREGDADAGDSRARSPRPARLWALAHPCGCGGRPSRRARVGLGSNRMRRCWGCWAGEIGSPPDGVCGRSTQVSKQAHDRKSIICGVDDGGRLRFEILSIRAAPHRARMPRSS
jgi:hypothetical protein